MNSDHIEKLWHYRDRFQALLEAAPPANKPALRVAVSGVDTVLRAAIENRGGVTISRERLVKEVDA